MSNTIPEQFSYPGYISLIFTIFCGLIQVTALIILIKRTKNKLPNLSILIAYLSILFFIIYNAALFAESLFIVTKGNVFTSRLCTILFMTPWLYKTGEVLMYLFYVNRLWLVFSESAFKYSKTSLSIFSLCIVFGFYVNNFIVTFMVFTNSSSFDNIQRIQDCIVIIDLYNNTDYLFSSAIIGLAIETVISIILLRLYLKKLALLSLAYDQYEFTSEGDKQKNEKFLKLIVKTTTLLINALIASYLALIILLLPQFGSFLLIAEHTVITLCIYLGFAVNNRLYRTLCCLCDKGCHKCCTFLCFCCCVPTHIDGTLVIAITENSKRHRFSSISESGQLQIRRCSASVSKSKGSRANCNTELQELYALHTSTVVMNTIKEIVQHEVTDDNSRSTSSPSENHNGKYIHRNTEGSYQEIETYKDHSLSIIEGTDGTEPSINGDLNIDLQKDIYWE